MRPQRLGRAFDPLQDYPLPPSPLGLTTTPKADAATDSGAPRGYKRIREWYRRKFLSCKICFSANMLNQDRRLAEALRDFPELKHTHTTHGLLVHHMHLVIDETKNELADIVVLLDGQGERVVLIKGLVHSSVKRERWYWDGARTEEWWWKAQNLDQEYEIFEKREKGGYVHYAVDRGESDLVVPLNEYTARRLDIAWDDAQK
ncbi:hypothetical protein NMY22_g16089 [Coprinellus aureogranulatus]|nr:hypothetical protein NMY22_g16089 [Coprinellus aureogranulatus]